MSTGRSDVVVVGGGVVGVAAALALARRGASVVLLEAAPGLALQATGTNSGILHTGFDSKPGELETELILRAAALRDPVLDALGVPVLRCGAVVEPRDAAERAVVDDLERGARANGVHVVPRARTARCEVPGRERDRPGRADARARRRGDRRGRRRARRARRSGRCAATATSCVVEAGDGDRACAPRAVVNAAGLRADEVARMAGDDSFQIFPRKGEFLVFEPPAGVAARAHPAARALARRPRAC